MKVFEIGHGKTGSTSLSSAMEILGYSTCHWPMREEKNESQFYRLVYGKSKTLPGFVRKFDFVSNGIDQIYPQLDTAFPDAKFILLIRNIDDWLISYQKHIDKYKDLDELKKYVKLTFGSEVFNENIFRKVYSSQQKSSDVFFAKIRPSKING